jgi:outer membrane protein TolC
MKSQHMIAISLAAAILLMAALPANSRAARSLTIQEARALALENNRTYLSAQQGVKIAKADVSKAKAGAFPSINLSGSYDRNFYIPSFFVQAEDDEGQSETIEFKTGFKNSYGANLSISQSIWSGGRVFTAMSIAKDYRNFSEDVADQVAATVVYQADVHFYAVALQRARVEVLTKSLEAAGQNLTVVENQFSQGQVSEFEVLRARVEKSNLEPQLLHAESNLRLAAKRLNSFLGLDLGEEISLVDESIDTKQDASLASLDDLTRTALELRPEMRQVEYTRDMRRKAIRIARAGYFPSLSAVANYNWQSQSDRMTLGQNINRSWTAGLRVTIPIFQGGRVRSEVTQAVAEHSQAILDSQQKRDDIKLEVEEAYDRLLQARNALELQENTIAQAEEGLRIANLRYESGVGILLEVLSAQAALTQARQILAEATFAYRTARAGLKLATTIDLDELQ